MTGLEIRANEGEQIQIGGYTVTVERARNGKTVLRTKTPPGVVEVEVEVGVASDIAAPC